MLAIRPNCQCFDKELPPEAADSFICSNECTVCSDCAEKRLPGGNFPNFGGELVRRPVRPPDRLAKHPASTDRVSKDHAFCS